MKLVTVQEMRAIEKESDQRGHTYEKMMEKAGHGLAEEIELLAYPEDEQREVLGLVGPGNNGGDTLVALAHLAAEGWLVRAYLVGRKTTGDALTDRLKKEGGDVFSADKDDGFENLNAFISTADVVVDGILGTGTNLPLRENIALVLNAVNESIASLPWPPYVVAVDCPTGVDSDSGHAAPETIPASQTVCMAAVKPGLLKFPASDYTGEIRVVDIGLPEDLPSWAAVTSMVVDEDMVSDILPVRSADSHKGTFGTVLIASGSVNYTGAPLLAGRAAYRIGAGLVQMAVPSPVQITIAGHFPEATWLMLPQELGVISESAAAVLLKNLTRATALLVGPGMGTEDTTRGFIKALLSGADHASKGSSRIGFVQTSSEKKELTPAHLPALVVDADALRLLAKIEHWTDLLPSDSILTPHPGEMAALTGLEKEAIQADRFGTAVRFAAEWKQVVVLKGAFTVIASPDGRAACVPIATSALAHAGTGDVLAGLIAGLRAQGVPAYEAAVAGAWIHAQAGIYAADRVGSEASVMAGDVLESVAEVLSVF